MITSTESHARGLKAALAVAGAAIHRHAPPVARIILTGLAFASLFGTMAGCLLPAWGPPAPPPMGRARLPKAAS